MAGRGITVVGVDTSPCSRRALRWALEDAAAHGRAVHVVLCHHDGGTHRHPTLAEQRDSAIAEAVALLDAEIAEVTSQVTADGGAPADVALTREVVLVGPAGTAEVLVDRAADADLLVVGRRGVHGIGRLLLGSVSEGCVARSPVPVVVVPCG